MTVSNDYSELIADLREMPLRELPSFVAMVLIFLVFLVLPELMRKAVCVALRKEYRSPTHRIVDDLEAES